MLLHSSTKSPPTQNAVSRNKGTGSTTDIMKKTECLRATANLQ